MGKVSTRMSRLKSTSAKEKQLCPANERTIPKRWLFMSLWDQLSWRECRSHKGWGGGVGGKGLLSELLTVAWGPTIGPLLRCPDTCSAKGEEGVVSCSSHSTWAWPCLSTYDCINWSRLSRKLLRRRFETLLLPKENKYLF